MKVKYLFFLPVIYFIGGCNVVDTKNKTNTEVVPIAEYNESISKTAKSELILETENKIEKILASYLSIKDALVFQDPKKVRLEAETIAALIKTVETKWLDEKKAAVFSTYGNTISHYAMLMTNAKSEIKIQRQYFEQMSISIVNLVKTFGYNRELYKKVCSTFNDGEGGYWVSEFSGTENPLHDSNKHACVKTIEIIK